MPNTAQRSAEYEILSLLRRRFCRWRRFFLHGVREESADCGRWSEKAKRETRKVAKAYGKEAQAPVPQATEKHEKPVGEHMGGAFHPKKDGYDGYYDDVLPSDAGKLKEGPDMELVKKVSAVAGVMLLIVILCVVAMYLL